ncbi:cephalosporin-C deacetylase [Microbacterium sp. BE35]|uniref:acetylxylan esterase n=1 Tax=Microbacterium sp. BE35 TaxID=2817773 RepID=UPI002857E499|nr:acetylxylan esterase [Microbacterium sp. BE35]MDR7188852.1 cephalosporin-C deacetylase [Microbacterium sp. BE35]
MTRFDLPVEELHRFGPDVAEPDDFDRFWAQTIAEARDAGGRVTVTDVDVPLRAVEARELTFPGFSGDPVRAWYLRPAGVATDLPAVVEFLGYGGGRGMPQQRLTWAAAGFAHIVMDTRGQAAADTADPHGSDPSVPGFLTRGIGDPATYYYRRVFTDGVRCVDAVRGLEGIDPSAVAVAGGSQGGGIALAVAGLRHDLVAAIVDYPFLCHFRRAVGMTGREPYQEVARYLAIHRDRTDAVFRTLSYFDGVNFAARATAPALFSVGLQDPVCPPSTVFAAYNAYAASVKEMVTFEFNEHEGGGAGHWPRQAGFLEEQLASAARADRMRGIPVLAAPGQ